MINILTVCLFALSLLTKTDAALAAAPKEINDHEKAAISCAETHKQNCRDSVTKDELKIIKLEPKIRILEHQQDDIVNPTELIPFVGGTGHVR